MRENMSFSLKITHFLSKNAPFLLKADCATRANVSAGTTLCANVRINRIVFTFRDCAHRALVNTCTASDAVS